MKALGSLLVCAGLLGFLPGTATSAPQVPTGWQNYYSPLAGIDATNAGSLGYAWSYDLNTTHGLEATPVVVDGVMYASAPWGVVHAVDARTGRRLWVFDPHADVSVVSKVCCDVVNRGLAVAQGRVFVASIDGRLFALDQRTGKALWHADTIIDHSRGYTVTGAVYVAHDLAVVGNAGGDYDARGYVSAYDVRTGQLRWRFFTVPANAHGPFENSELKEAARTWDPDSFWQAGGGGTVWGGMAYDSKLNLLYFGTGNAEVYPQKLRSPRGGDNLFTSSVLAIHADTGRLAWHYQEVPGDQWDYDSDASVVLADLKIKGRPRKVLLHAPKDGFFYVLDRESGELLSAEPYVPVSWARGVDKSTGRPLQSVQADYSQGPRLVFPSVNGGHNWQPMAFNPQTRLAYIPAAEAGSVFWLPQKPFVYERGAVNEAVSWVIAMAGENGLGSEEARSLPPLSELSRGQPDTTLRGFLRAWDPVTNRVAWQVETSDRWVGQLNALWNGGGVMTTAGGLVFQGRSTGYLHVYRADNGRQIAAVNVGANIMAAPTTYELDGVQYVAALAGSGGAWGGTYYEGTAARRYGNAGKIIALKLGGGPVPLPAELPPAVEFPRPAVMRTASADVIERGSELFERNCSLCHKNGEAAGTVPDLRRMSAQTHAQFEDIVLKGVRAAKGMGSFARVLSADDVQAIHAFLVDAAWREYERQHPKPHSGGHSSSSTDVPAADLVPGIPVNTERNAYYGDLHLHTTYSFDVYLQSNITPDDAYRFAKGESVTYLKQTVKRSSPPLDFLAVTDHSENIGALNALDDPRSGVSRSEFGQRVHREGLKLVGEALIRGVYDDARFKYLSSVADVSQEAVTEASRDAWQHEIEAANRNYQPGRFTTFIGYEWTSHPGDRNLHRNVIFRGDRAPAPFTSADSTRPEDLWDFLDRIRKEGFEALAIPHNANASDGLMFDWLDSYGKPIDRKYAEQRATNEPLTEIVQEKGQSETHPLLSPTDEFANFEIMDFMKGLRPGKSSHPAGSYVREGLGRGMEIAQHTGVNPFKYGFVGASDLHTGLSESSEQSVAENVLLARANSQKISEGEKQIEEGAKERYRDLLPTHAEDYIENPYELGSPGLTGVWAEENTRESIFAALKRKETFATSGSRLRVRFFGGWNYTRSLMTRADWVSVAYRGGVPMGGNLHGVSRRGAPTFALWAVKDPDGANLDRLQVIKLWLEGGKQQEAVFDVALSNGRAVDPRTGKAPPVGSTVNLETATYTNTIGATELSAVWQDPHFDSATPAVYYLRALEIPTPRYSTIASVKRGVPPPEGVPTTIQERGWSSPIWYSAPALIGKEKP